MVLATLSFTGYAQATSAAWDGSTSNVWSLNTNWLSDPLTAPGSGETATFDGAGNGNTIIDLEAGVTIGNIVFDKASAGAYTIGSVGQTLTFNTASSGNAVTLNSTVATNQIINANILVNTADNTLRFLNSTATTTGPTLTINGTIQGGSSPAKTINVAGNVNLIGAISAGTAASIAVGQVGAGNLIFGGTATSNLLSLSPATAGGKTIVNGQTLNISSRMDVKKDAIFELQSGAANFTNGMRSDSSDNSLMKVSGGVLTTSSVELRRTGSISSASGPASSTHGFVLTGGAANVTTTFAIGTADSSASTLVTGGALTIGGAVNIGNTTHSSRYCILEVRGGSLTSTDSTNGIVLSLHTTTANKSSLLLTGGTSTAERISFGRSTSVAGSEGNVTVNGGDLYVGSGGIVKSATNSYAANINLTSGLLGAKADWSSSLPMNVNGTSITIKSADALDASRNITLNGALSGAGGITKTGNGVLALGSANTFSGQTTINAGVVRLDHANGVQNSTVALNIDNGLGFGTGIAAATIGGLSGSAGLALTNADSNAVVMSVGNNNANTTYSGIFSGAGSLKKIGSGSLTLDGDNSAYTNGIALENGVLCVNLSSAAGPSANTITAANGTRIHGGSSLGTNTAAAAIVLSGESANVILSNNNASGGFGSAISGTSDQTLTISSVGGTVVNLNSSTKQLQNFYGTVLVPSGSSLGFRSTSLSNGSDNALFEVNGSITTRNNGNLALGALAGSGVLSMGTNGSDNTTLTYIVGARNTSTSFSGAIQDGDTATGKRVAVTKTGSAVLTLSGTTTYSGNTTVSAGTLRVNGTHTGGGNYVVNANATLGGTGQITLASGKSLTVNALGKLAPGASIGVLTIDAPTVTLAADSNLVIEVDNSGGIISAADQLVIGSSAASIDINGAELSFDFVSPTMGAVTHTTPVVIVNNQSSTDITTDFKDMPRNENGSFAKLTGALQYTLYYRYNASNGQTTGGNDIAIQFNAVPEPSVGFLLAGAMLGCRRKRSAAH
jgi:autotransporter-associated beta strand protein